MIVVLLKMGTYRMNNLAENNLIRFINITKKKDGIFANFKVQRDKGWNGL